MDSIIYKLFKIILLTTFFTSTINSQSLIDGAESVAFDSLNNRYLVTSLRTNKVISIDKTGNQTIFKENITAFGNCTKDSVLYVAGGSKIRGLNVFTGEDVFSVTIPGTHQFDGITVDNSGNLYAMGTVSNRVYKINIKTKTFSLFVNGGFESNPQDLIYDKFKNRILVCHWSANSPIMSISLEDSVLTTVVEKTSGFADGITIDKLGNIYVTSYERGGEIYRYDNDFSKPGELIYVGIEEPSGLDYNIKDDVLAVPSFSGDKVVFIKMPPIYLFPKIESSHFTGNAPLTIKFNDNSFSYPKINYWEWDFNSDGIIDSYEQNPEWKYTEAGTYKVSVLLKSDSLNENLILEDSILIFDKESSINFRKSPSSIKIIPNSKLNLTNEWTFEAWIKPINLLGKYILYKNAVSIYTNKKSAGLKDNSLVVKFILEDGSTIRFSSEDSSLVLNKWQHIAFSYNFLNKTMKIFINGKQQELSTDESTIFISPIMNNELDTLILGNNNTGLRNLTGNMDEVRIWHKALTNDEINANIYKYLVGTEDSLIGYWNFNEGNGQEVFDISNNGNIGNILGAEYDWGVDYSTLVNVNESLSEGIKPNELTLFQNYPNPFNPSTIIKYSIPTNAKNENSKVKLVVFDVLGKEVATLVNKHQNTGNYEVNFDASNLSSGVYIYQLQRGGYLFSRKMILIK